MSKTEVIPTAQLVPTERYVQMVRDLGIEEAYKQRFRGTGRTVRDVLTLVMNMSHGNKVVLTPTAAPGRNRSNCEAVLKKVAHIARELGMNINYTGDSVIYEMSGGEVLICPNYSAGYRLDEYEEYKLHDC